MRKLILVRYGEWENDHLNEAGKKTMISIAERLKPLIQNLNCHVISANIPRAIESAKILSENLNLPPAESFAELYATEESNRNPDTETAIKLITFIGKSCEMLIVVASREYVEILPIRILNEHRSTETELKRGEILVIDIESKIIDRL